MDFGVLKPGFGCIIKFKKIIITSILAPNIYGCSTRGGRGAVSVDTNGEGVGGASPSHGRDLFEILVQNTSFSCIKMLKFT